MCMNWLFHSYLVPVLELFQSDTKSMVFEYKATQILEIVLLNFYFDLCQILPISYHNTYTFLLLPNHNFYYVDWLIFSITELNF